MSNILFSKEYRQKEFKIGRVTFISIKRLHSIRKKIGIQNPLSQYKFIREIDPKSLSKCETFAIIRFNNSSQELREEVFNEINDALNILALSELGYCKRYEHTLPLNHGFNEKSNLSYYSIGYDNISNFWGFRKQGNIRPFEFDNGWSDYHKKGFFFKLVKIINKEILVSNGKWNKTLKRCAIMAGQSQSSKNLVQAFLWNMIVLEGLLTKHGDRHSKALPKRIESFIGWVGFWETDNYQDKIKEIYQKRCDIVHDCNYSNLEIKDLLFSDDLVLNVLDNIINHITLFQSKEDLIKFTDKVEAEHVLGIKGKTRPKTLKMFIRTYKDFDLRYFY